ncbi:MAG TPA: ABC transporter permease [Candidatus Methylomirabilis sp.]|nr:ABC transporter permease [Candidatus Methylomirabilis sp.]
MENFLRDIRYGIRTLAKSPGFAIVGVLTLALGIGANTAIFSVVENVLLRPLPYPHPESLVQIWNTYSPQVPRGALSPGDYADWHQQATSFSEMGAYGEVSKGLNLTGVSEPQRVLVGYASSDLFPMLGVSVAAGRSFVPEENRAGTAPVVMLGHRLWLSRFGGDGQVVGRTITLDNKRYTVVGILPVGFQLLRWADLWMPLGQFDDDLTEHVHHAFVAIARLKPGVSLSQARDEVGRLNQQEAIAYPDAHKGFGVLVQKLEDPSAASLRSTLLVLFGAVGLVLLIACANIVNLLLVRNAAREREVALRTALGASPWRLIRQLLTESTLLSLTGGVLGMFFAVAGLKVLLAFAPADLAILSETGLNGWALGFTTVVCLTTGLACGLLPALRTLNANLAGVLQQGNKGASASGHHRTHNLLVISEIAMALVPLIGAGLLLRSFQHLLEVDPGFRADHILMMEVHQPALSFAQFNQLSQDEQTKLGQKQSMQFEQIAAQIRALPGVKEAGGIDDLPLGNELRQASRFVIEGQPVPTVGARPIAQTRTVSLSYFSSLTIPLRAGRYFNEDDWKVLNIVINEKMAQRYWPQGDAIGKRVNLCSLDPKPCWFTIVGIAGNVHQFGLDAEPTYDVYFAGGWTPFLVVRTTSNPATVAAAVRDVVHKVDPNLPIAHVTTMEGLLSDSLSPRRFSAVLIGIFAGLALLLAAIGIYGVMSYTVSRRTQEIGVRMALGAQLGNVRGMILGQTLKLTLIGVGLGLAGAFVVARFLASLLFGVGTYDPVTFVGVALLLIGVALAASYVPARRAMRVDPIVALRYE